MPSRLRVPLGWVVGAVVLWLARPNLLSLLLGVPLALLGEALRLWASGHIDKTRALATGGPYAHTRNPLYVGSVLLAIGVAVASANLGVVAVGMAYLGAFYPAAIREEASFLRGRFEHEYAEWAAAVPLFLPRLMPAGPRASRFLWARVARNREWRAALALPLAVLVLWARARFIR